MWTDGPAADDLERLVSVLSEVLDDAPLGFAVFDTELRFRFVNSFLCGLHGLGAEQHLGRTMAELFPEEQVAAVEPPIRAVLRSGVPDRDHELRLVVAGSPHDFLINRYPMRGSGSAVLGIAVTVQDLTELRQAAREREAQISRARAEAEHRLSQVQRLTGVGTWDIDAITGEVTWSAEMYRLLGADDGLPVDPTRVIHPQDLPIAQYHWSELTAGRTRTTEMRLIRPDGGVIVALVAGSPVFGAAGRVVGARGTVLDVTELRAAQHAVERARMDREHSIRLQNALLPARLPDVAGIDVVVAYEPADSNAAIGGDFYDCFPVDDDRVAFVIGDVTGHDIESAALMSQVRAVTAAYALEGLLPDQIVHRVNQFVRRLPSRPLVSLIVGIYETGGHFSFANAGHLPPIKICDTSTTTLTAASGPILGAASSWRWPTTTAALLPDETLFFYTDGLVEQRTVVIDESIEKLRRALDRVRLNDTDSLVRTALRLSAPGQREDDVCILALRRTA